MIDTNILLDWLLDRDSDHTQRIDAFFAQKKVFLVSDLVLVELVFALEKFYELPRHIVAQNLTQILDSPFFTCNRSLFSGSLADYIEHPSLSFIDCYLLQQATLLEDLPLWTFDKKLVNQSSGRAQLLN